MQFPVMVLVPKDTTLVLESVGRLMEPYNVARKAPPHKEYVPKDEIDYIIEVFGLEATDADAVLAELEEDSGFSGGIDEEGIYLMSTDNPEGHWDTWRIRDLREDVHHVADMPRDHAPAAVVTPDGIWHDLDAALTSQEDVQASRWKQAEVLLAQYPAHLAVTVHCHL